MDKQKKLRHKLLTDTPEIVLKYTVDLELKNEVYEDILNELEILLQDNEVSKASLIVEFNKLKNAINERLLAKLSEFEKL
jgi:hypothetical protein